MRLLLAFDPLDSSGVIASQVATRPWPNDTVAQAFTVIEDAAIPEEVWRVANGNIEVAHRQMQGRAEEVVWSAVDELNSAGVQAEAVIRIGDPRLEIVAEASEWPADFILVRPHVFKSITRWLLGSVSKVVLRDAPCSVEVVRNTREDATRYAHDGMKILLATDGSDYSKAAASSVAGRPWFRNSEIRVISVAALVGHRVEVEPEPNEESDDRRAVKMMPEEKAVLVAEEIVARAGLKVSGATLTGRPEAAIVDEAKAWGADLVVVGSHGRRGIERIVLGSVSEAVALHAPSSVEVIRSPALVDQS